MDPGLIQPKNCTELTEWNYPSIKEGLSLYIHFPFCETKCAYCDFNTYAGIENLRPHYAESLEKEIRAWGAMLQKPPLMTIFLGGGTPSYMGGNILLGIMDAVREAFYVAVGAEVTLEANPDDVAEDELSMWLEAGMNRISMGVQSLNDSILEFLGRRHDAAAAEKAFRMAARVFSNRSLDLIYGIPYQTMECWQNTLLRALDMEPSHISMYGLQIEHGTPLERDVRMGAVETPDEDLSADMYEWASETAENAGLTMYEISNWAHTGKESLHNLTYWRNMPYLGVGTGAHSSLMGRRFANCRSPKEYIKRTQDLTMVPQDDPVTTFLERGTVAEIETTDRRMAMAETMMLGLRLREGVADEKFRRVFGAGIADVYGEPIRELQAEGLIEWRLCAIQLTPRGRLLGNEVFRRFVAST